MASVKIKKEVEAEVCFSINVRLRDENQQLRAGIKAVRDLISESDGVSGLHNNGEVATWDSLEEGGHFEEWLIEFNAAEDV